MYTALRHTIASKASLQTGFLFCAHKSFEFTWYTYSHCMPRVHFMTFEPTGNTCAILLARAFGMVVASSLVHPGTRLGRWPCATIAGDESSATISVTKCEKDGEVYAERVPESKRGFKHLTEREDMVVSQDGHSLLH